MNLICTMTSLSAPYRMNVYVRCSSVLQQELFTCYTDKRSIHLVCWVVELPCLSQTHLLWQFFYTGRMTVTQECKVRTCFVNPLLLCCMRTRPNICQKIYLQYFYNSMELKMSQTIAKSHFHSLVPAVIRVLCSI